MYTARLKRPLEQVLRAFLIWYITLISFLVSAAVASSVAEVCYTVVICVREGRASTSERCPVRYNILSATRFIIFNVHIRRRNSCTRPGRMTCPNVKRRGTRTSPALLAPRHSCTRPAVKRRNRGEGGVLGVWTPPSDRVFIQ